MANKKFSQTWIDKLKGPDPSGKPKLYWDENLTGFGVWVSGKKNVKTYVVQYAIGRGGKNLGSRSGRRMRSASTRPGPRLRKSSPCSTRA